MLKKGQRVTDFRLVTSTGAAFGMDELSRYRATALFFYPRDFTTICTAQACHFRDRYREIQELGGRAFGVSTDGDDRHAQFRERHALPFELVQDESKTLGRLFGVLRMAGWFGHKRATFVLAPDATLLDVIHNEMNATIHADRFIDVLRSLKA